MKLLLPLTIVERLKHALRRGKSSEIGGVLVGEHVAGDVFRIVDLSVQLSGGTAAHFVRDPVLAKAFLDAFFQRTGNAYGRFNYIGEWHTHPNFEPLPSGEDCTTMIDLVHDPAVGVNFAVLIIVRARPWSRIELSATLFRQGAMPEAANVEVDDDQQQKRGVWARILRFFQPR